MVRWLAANGTTGARPLCLPTAVGLPYTPGVGRRARDLSRRAQRCAKS